MKIKKDYSGQRINITGAGMYYLAKDKDNYYADKLKIANQEIIRLKKVITGLKLRLINEK